MSIFTTSTTRKRLNSNSIPLDIEDRTDFVYLARIWVKNILYFFMFLSYWTISVRYSVEYIWSSVWLRQTQTPKGKRKKKNKKEQKQRSEIKGTNFLVYFFLLVASILNTNAFLFFILKKVFFIFLFFYFFFTKSFLFSFSTLINTKL